MKVRPEFFGWSAALQERYGVAIPQDDQARLDQVLLVELFGRKSRTLQAAARAADRLPIEEQNVWNETILPLIGIGEDSFFLNEWLGEGKTLLDFETLRDYDEDDYRFQEAARAGEDSAYVCKPYRGSLYGTWARLFIDERFAYASLSMGADYLAMELRDYASDLVRECVPHRYLRGKSHGKREGAGFEWDMRVDAGGQEALLDALQHRVFEYERERYEALVTYWDDLGRRGVYCLDVSEAPESTFTSYSPTRRR